MRKLLSILIFIAVNFSLSQNQSNNDTIHFKSYSELKSIFYKNLSDKKVAKKIANYTLWKAKKDNNYEEVSNSYIRLYFTFKDSLRLSEKYIDSAITVSGRYNNLELLHEGYYFKGLVNDKLRNYNIALSHYLKARKYYKDKSLSFYHEIQHNIGLLKFRIDEYQEALNILEENLKYEKSQGNDIKITKSYLKTLYALGIVYTSVNQYEKSSKVSKEGYKLSSKKKYSQISPLNFSQIEGVNLYFQKNYRAARDSLLMVIPHLIKTNASSNLAHVYFYLGKITCENSEYENCLSYYKKIDSLFLETNYVIPEFREAYKVIIDHYKLSKDLKHQLYYTDRLLYADSILEIEYKGLSRKFHKDYDIHDILDEREKIIDQLNYKWTSVFTVTSGVFILLIVLLFIYYYRRKIKMEKDFDELLLKLNSQGNNKEILNKEKTQQRSKNSKLKEHIVEDIITKLDKFEKNNKFLEPKIVIREFAKELDTNEKYLSIVINDYKGMSYNNYINNLKINHAIYKLKNDKNFRKYTIKAIAEEVGFLSTQAFTKAFYKNTNITVSYFMKNLKN